MLAWFEVDWKLYDMVNDLVRMMEVRWGEQTLTLGLPSHSISSSSLWVGFGVSMWGRVLLREVVFPPGRYDQIWVGFYIEVRDSVQDLRGHLGCLGKTLLKINISKGPWSWKWDLSKFWASAWVLLLFHSLDEADFAKSLLALLVHVAFGEKFSLSFQQVLLNFMLELGLRLDLLELSDEWLNFSNEDLASLCIVAVSFGEYDLWVVLRH